MTSSAPSSPSPAAAGPSQPLDLKEEAAVLPAATAALMPVAVPAAAPAPAVPPAEDAVSTLDYDLILFRQKTNRAAQHRDADLLSPVRGSGYPTLYALIGANQKHRSSPLEGSRASCTTATQCEYLPVRKPGLPERFTLTLSDGSPARLTATDDLVAINMPALASQTPLTLSLTLTIPGQPAIIRKINYARSTADGAPSPR